MINSFIYTINATALSFLIGNLVSNKNAVNGIVNVVALGSSFLCGVFVPTQYLPDSVKTIWDYAFQKNNLTGTLDLPDSLRTIWEVAFASNNLKYRVRRIGDYLGVHAFYLVRKPSGKIKKLLLNKINIEMDEVAIIGDQIMTDINMGNRLGMKTILVDPMGEKDLKITFFNRLMEKIVLKIIKVKRGVYYE